MIKYIRDKLFKSDKLVKDRGLYAVTKGQHLGDFYLFYELELSTDGTKYKFVQLPDFHSVILNEEIVKQGIENKILDFITIIKQKAFQTMMAEFQFRQESK